MQDESNDKNWRLIPTFDHQSRSPFSGASGQVKREHDPGIIRPLRGYIEMEGFFDLTVYDAEQLAGMIGWIPVEEAEALRAEAAALRAELADLRGSVAAEAIDTLQAHFRVDL